MRGAVLYCYLLLGFAVLAAAQTRHLSAFTGTWKFNAAKSDFKSRSTLQELHTDIHARWGPASRSGPRQRAAVQVRVAVVGRHGRFCRREGRLDGER